MGYQTDYFISVETEKGEIPSPEVMEELEDALQDEDLSVYFEFSGRAEMFNWKYQFSSADSYKWYDYEEDMKWISSRIPEIEFTVVDFGEDKVDMWYQFFRNGVTDGPHTLMIHIPNRRSQKQ